MAVTSLRVSSKDFPGPDRLEFLRETYGRTVLKVELEAVGAGPIETDLMLRELPNLGVASGYCSQLRVAHTSQLADSDDLVLLMVTEGATVMQHRGREEMIADGEALLTTSAEIGHNRMLGPIRCLNLGMPARVLVPMMDDLAQVLMRPIRRDNAALKLLAGYFRALDETTFGDAGLSRLVASQVQDLVALAVGATRDAAELARGRGVRAARLRLIKHDVLELLGEPGLSAPMMAARHGVSERYLRRLFEQEETSFSAYVLEQRLARVYRQLGDPRYAGAAISTLAYGAGFNDLSYFNKAFRRTHGATPSDIRASASRF